MYPQSLPRVCGVLPYLGCLTHMLIASSPRVRGLTAKAHGWVSSCCVFPARAGVNRAIDRLSER